ncbi:peptidylprolyl isomerase, partial [Streptomyces sp. NPDC052727]|uniref:peptidylprolyl isomerase n=1 Tax=Streptomyces sp. NPDC052727 TaxID=3154854 RepID=UPI0034322896
MPRILASAADDQRLRTWAGALHNQGSIFGDCQRVTFREALTRRPGQAGAACFASTASRERRPSGRLTLVLRRRTSLRRPDLRIKVAGLHPVSCPARTAPPSRVRKPCPPARHFLRVAGRPVRRARRLPRYGHGRQGARRAHPACRCQVPGLRVRPSPHGLWQVDVGCLCRRAVCAWPCPVRVGSGGGQDLPEGDAGVAAVGVGVGVDVVAGAAGGAGAVGLQEAAAVGVGVPQLDGVVLTPHLNRKHTIFGQVVSGQDVVHAIANVPTTQ